MAETDPMGGGSTVALDFPVEHTMILRDVLTSCLEGLRGDMGVPDELRNPDKDRREAAAYKRLLAALERGELLVPDEAAREAVEAIAAAADRENNYAEVLAEHDALHGLLTRLAPSQAEGDGA